MRERGVVPDRDTASSASAWASVEEQRTRTRRRATAVIATRCAIGLADRRLRASVERKRCRRTRTGDCIREEGTLETVVRRFMAFVKTRAEPVHSTSGAASRQRRASHASPRAEPSLAPAADLGTIFGDERCWASVRETSFGRPRLQAGEKGMVWWRSARPGTVTITIADDVPVWPLLRGRHPSLRQHQAVPRSRLPRLKSSGCRRRSGPGDRVPRGLASASVSRRRTRAYRLLLSVLADCIASRDKTKFFDINSLILNGYP